MKSVTPKSRILALVGNHAPSSQVLAMIMLGGCVAGVVSNRNSETDTTRNEISLSDNRSKDVQSTQSAAPPRVVQQTLTAGKPKLMKIMGISNNDNSTMQHPTIPTPQILASSSIIATSDAKAEQSASLAAMARLSGNSSSVAPTANNSTTEVKVKSKATDNNERNVHKMGHTKPSGGDTNDSVKNQSNGPTTPSPSKDDQDDDSYPTFTPYHNSLLKKYLTPEVWAKLSHLQTKQGTTIEDIIRAGLALPIGSNPPRRVGVLVGDAECYTVFSELLDPIISEYHGIENYEEWMDPELPTEMNFRKMQQQVSAAATSAVDSSGDDADYGIIKSSGADDDSDENDDAAFLLDEEDDSFVEYVALPNNNTQSLASTSAAGAAQRNVERIASNRKANLRRHSTIINNPRLVTNREADPEGKYIISTRIRVARSLDGMKFPPTMSRGDRRKVQRLIGDCTQHFQGANLSHGTYLPILSMTNDQNLDLIERHILFDNPNEWTIASGLGRDWPDGRALYANVTNLQVETPDFMIWVNEEDHLRIMCLRAGGDIQGVFTTLMNGARELERELTKRGWHFAYDSRLGYLTSCPTNVGTTMRASVHVRLTKLGRLPGFFDLVTRLKLEARGKYGETDRHYTGVFDISNAERLGKSEVHLINVMVEGVAKLIELERRLEAGEVVDINGIA